VGASSKATQDVFVRASKWAGDEDEEKDEEEEEAEKKEEVEDEEREEDPRS